MQATTFKVRVEALRDEAHGIRSFSIARLDGQPFGPYEPGAHIDVTSPSGITRQYSLCGDPEHVERQFFAVKKEPESRGGSRSLHDEVAVGSELTVGAPRNLFRLAPDARRHVLIGAGIGITPLISMAYRLVKLEASFELHYFARSEAHAAFLPLLAREPFARHTSFHFGVTGDGLDASLAACLANAPGGTHLYTCGPAPFMDRVVAAGEACVPADAIHLERFAAAPATPPGEVAHESFEVRIATTGQTVRVEKDTSIVDALATIGIEIDTSCGEGVCGTCMIDVVEGEPEHRDHCLSNAERASNKVICCCVSRSRSPLLVLDL